MKKSAKYRLIVLLVVLPIIVFAQSKSEVEVDTMTKIVGFILMVGGIYNAYVNMQMGKRMAEFEVKIQNLVTHQIEKIDSKLEIAVKDLRLNMASKTDIESLKRDIDKNERHVTEQMSDIKDRLKDAAEIYKRDNK